MATATAEERRAADLERLEEALRALMTSDGWERWVKTRKHFRAYSLNNQLLIAMQCPTASRVAGYKTWQKLGRQVLKGEKSIRIFAPISGPCRSCDGNGTVSGLTCGRCFGKGRWLSFRVVSVFDVAQTDGEELAEPPRQPIDGETHAHLIPAAVAYAESLGYSVTFEPQPGARGGSCDIQRKAISVESDKPANARLRTLVHEIAHAHGIDYSDYTRSQSEVIVETVTIMVCGSAGLDTSGESLPYIAGWGEGDDLEALKTFAATIDDVASKLETALGLDGKGAAVESAVAA